MVALSALFLVTASVRLGLVMSIPRTTEERDAAGEQEVTGEAQSHHKAVHRRHRAKHRTRGVIPPEEAEVRCYCNLPACVTTGFVCQSMVGACFSETTASAGVAGTQHGCLELLSRHKQHICERLQGEGRRDGWLRCCAHDMCNLVESGDVRLAATHTLRTPPHELPTPPPELLSMGGRQAASSGELWLRAATIAVPIAGVFILGVLVLLAVRMLRRETKPPPPYQYAKAPLEPAGEPAPAALAPAAPSISSGGRLLAPPGPEARVDVHRAVCCVYAMVGEARCSCAPTRV